MELKHFPHKPLTSMYSAANVKPVSLESLAAKGDVTPTGLDFAPKLLRSIDFFGFFPYRQ